MTEGAALELGHRGLGAGGGVAGSAEHEPPAQGPGPQAHPAGAPQGTGGSGASQGIRGRWGLTSLSWTQMVLFWPI